MYSEQDEFDTPKMATHGGLNTDFRDDEPVPESAAVDIRDFERTTGYYRASGGSGTTAHNQIVGQHKNYPTIKLIIQSKGHDWKWMIEEKIDDDEEEVSPLNESSVDLVGQGVYPIVWGETIGELFQNPKGSKSEEWEEKRWELYENDENS
jgi:hypothetical protein